MVHTQAHCTKPRQQIPEIRQNMEKAIKQREQLLVALENEIAFLRAAQSITEESSKINEADSQVITNFFDRDATSKEHPEQFQFDKKNESNLRKTLCASLALVNEPPVQGSVECTLAQSKAFQQFFLVAADLHNNDPHTPKLLRQIGTRYLDPFVLESANIVDSFPCGNESSASESLSKTGVSTAPYKAQLPSFCLPNGVKVRLVPRVALNRANRIGWLGRSADKYHVLVFTDSHGTASHGVAITVHEEIHNPRLEKLVKYSRACRRAAVLISNWWRQCRQQLYQTSNIQNGLPFGSDQPLLMAKSKDKGRAVQRISSTPNLFRSWPQQESEKRPNSMNRSSSNWFLYRKPGGCGDTKNTRNKKFGKSCASFKFRPGQPTAEKHESETECKNHKEGIREVLQHFLKTSPIPLYDKKERTGVWLSAKIKFKCVNNVYIVVLTHYPLKMEKRESEIKGKVKPYDYTQYYRKERKRLRDMLRDVDSLPPVKTNRSKPCKVSTIVFNEINKGGKIIASHPLHLNGVSLKEEQAEEAYEEMILSENLGEALVVEKCYVLVGCEPRRHSILLAALQEVVNADRTSELYRSGTWSDDFSSKLYHAENSSRGNIGVPHSFHFFGDTHTPQTESRSDRHRVLAEIQKRAFFSLDDTSIYAPEMKQRDETGRTLKLNLPFQRSRSIVMPLPLPQIAEEWGLATLLLRMGSTSLLKVLKALLLERSVLVIGDNTGEVTSSTCALLKLLQPYDWAGVFLPLLPTKMLELVNAPVPFVVGLSVDGVRGLRNIESNPQVQNAICDGMVFVNLADGTLAMQLLDEAVDPHGLSETIESLEDELKEILQKPSSLYCSLESFVYNGLSVHEQKILHTVREVILDYMTSLAGEIATDKNAWRKYGTYDALTHSFDFCPSSFYKPLFAELQFRKKMVHTQMFSSFVQSKRDEDLRRNAIHRQTTSNVLGKFMKSKWNAAQSA